MEDKTYDCLTCPYPRHKTPELIFCDVCIRRIMDEHHAKKIGRRKAMKHQTNKIPANAVHIDPQRASVSLMQGPFVILTERNVAT